MSSRQWARRRQAEPDGPAAEGLCDTTHLRSATAGLSASMTLVRHGHMALSFLEPLLERVRCTSKRSVVRQYTEGDPRRPIGAKSSTCMRVPTRWSATWNITTSPMKSVLAPSATVWKSLHSRLACAAVTRGGLIRTDGSARRPTAVSSSEACSSWQEGGLPDRFA